MIKNTVSIEEFRTNLADLVGRVMYGKDLVFIKKYNRDAAVLLSVEDYEKLVDPTKRLSKKQWDKAVEKLEAVRANIPDTDPEKIENTVSQVIQKVRSELKSKA